MGVFGLLRRDLEALSARFPIVNPRFISLNPQFFPPAAGPYCVFYKGIWPAAGEKNAAFER